MAKSAILSIKILTDATKAKKGMDDAASGVDKFKAGLEKAVIPAGIAIAAVGAFAKSSVDAASRTQRAMGAVETVFKDNADTIKGWSKTAADSVGLPQSAYLEMAAVVGSQLKGLGVPLDQVTGKTGDLIKMGADLAATYGGTTQQAVEALGAALRGETDPIERYGISLKQADVAAKMAEQGTKGLTGAAGKQAKAAATLALLTQGAADANGAFAREADTAAHAQQVANAHFEDAKAALGQALLPALTSAANALAGLAGFVQDNTTAFTVFLGVVAGVAGIILAVNVAMKAYAAGQAIASAATAFSTSTLGTWLGVKALEAAAWIASTARSIAATVALYAYTAAMTVLNAITKIWAAVSAAAWLAALGPIALVIAAVLAVVAVIVILWKRSETFRSIVLGVWAAIRSAFGAAVSWIKANWLTMLAVMTGPLGIAVALIIRNWTTIKAAVASVVAFIKAVWSGGMNAVKALITANINAIRAVFNTLRGAAAGIGAALSAPFNAVGNAISHVIGLVQSLISALGRIHVPKISLPSIPGLSFNAAPTGFAAAPGLARAGVTAAPIPRAVGPTPTIIVQGAVDPESTARQLRRILDSHGRRQGMTGVLRTGLV